MADMCLISSHHESLGAQMFFTGVSLLEGLCHTLAIVEAVDIRQRVMTPSSVQSHFLSTSLVHILSGVKCLQSCLFSSISLPSLLMFSSMSEVFSNSLQRSLSLSSLSFLELKVVTTSHWPCHIFTTQKENNNYIFLPFSLTHCLHCCLTSHCWLTCCSSFNPLCP